jgi:hypothetical protein
LILLYVRQKQLQRGSASSKAWGNCSKEEDDFLMSDRKKDQPVVGPSPSAPATARAEKVRSSRYEWENRNGDNEKPPADSKQPKESVMASFTNWLRKLFSGENGLFDKDDDATPSAA